MSKILRAGVLLAALAVSSCSTAQHAVPINVHPEATLDCGEGKVSSEIYRNRTSAAVTVHIQATDACSGIDSELVVRDASGESLQTEAVPDGGSKAFSFTVVNGGSIFFSCKGNGGRQCKYSLSFAPVR